MGARGASQLCTLITACVAEFNHVNVSTALRKLLQDHNNGGLSEVVQRALRSLEESALHNIEDFESQTLANTLHAMAKARYTPTNPLVIGALERRAEALAGTFNAQGVANTLWAYATMGRKPGAGLMKELEGLAEALAGTFNAQAVANTLWAYATMGREPGCRPTPRRM